MKKFVVFMLSLILSLSPMALTACNVQTPHEHEYEMVSDAKAHWRVCSCGDKKDQEKHYGGIATETQKAKCLVCNQEYGNILAPGHTHDFSKQVSTDKYLSSAATCKSKALYFYSCECGEKGSNTFESGAIGFHSFSKGECIHCGTPEKEDVVTGPY